MGKRTQTLDRGTLLRRPASRSHLFTVDVETGVLWVQFNEAAGITTNPPREDHPPKLPDQGSRALIREATKRPKITLKELQSSTAEIGVSVRRTTLSRTLHRAGLYG